MIWPSQSALSSTVQRSTANLPCLSCPLLWVRGRPPQSSASCARRPAQQCHAAPVRRPGHAYTHRLSPPSRYSLQSSSPLLHRFIPPRIPEVLRIMIEITRATFIAPRAHTVNFIRGFHMDSLSHTSPSRIHQSPPGICTANTQAMSSLRRMWHDHELPQISVFSSRVIGSLPPHRESRDVALYVSLHCRVL